MLVVLNDRIRIGQIDLEICALCNPKIILFFIPPFFFFVSGFHLREMVMVMYNQRNGNGFIQFFCFSQSPQYSIVKEDYFDRLIIPRAKLRLTRRPPKRLTRQLLVASRNLLDDTNDSFYVLYRVFIKYCVFFQEFSTFCVLSLASTGLLLVGKKMASH